MRIFILIILSTLIQTSSFAQTRIQQDEMVVWATEVNLRETPSIGSRVLATISNGEIVKPIYEEGVIVIREQINDIYGYWEKVEYKSLVGYIFSTYIGPKYQHFYEGDHISYFPTVNNWYGIYYDSISRNEIIKKVGVKVVKTKYEGDPKEHKILYTNQRSKSLFLIATNVEMPDREIGLFTKRFENDTKFLRPGDSQTLYYKSEFNTVSGVSYNIFSTGTYELENNSLRLSNYKVFLSDRSPIHSQPTLLQDLTQILNINGVCEIVYFGDIDNDKKPDLILNRCGNNCIEILFLSSMAKEGELLRSVSVHYVIDEC